MLDRHHHLQCATIHLCIVQHYDDLPYGRCCQTVAVRGNADASKCAVVVARMDPLEAIQFIDDIGG